MPVVSALSYPGVYIQEIPSGVRTITGVATSITAFIGRALRGPVNDAVMILSFAEFERQFGGADAGYPLSYAVRDFFMNGGAQAIIVRLYTPLFATQLERNAAVAAATTNAQAGAAKVAKAASGAAAVAGAKPADVVAAANGALAGLTGAGKAAGELVAAAAKKKADDAGTTATDVAGVATAAKTDAVKAAAGGAAPFNRARLTLPPTGASGVVLEAATPGVWGNVLQVTVDWDIRKNDDGSDNPNLFNLGVAEVPKDGSPGRTEKFLNVSCNENDARYVTRVLIQESSLVRTVGKPTVRPDEGKTQVDSDGQASDSKPLESSGFIGDPNQKTGLYALEKTDLFNLLCIPADTRAGNTPKDVYEKALAYCVTRRAMLLIDPPHAWSANASTAAAAALDGLDKDIGLSGPSARNAAIFFPRLLEVDPMRGGQIAEFVPCGAVAGIFARTDSTRGVWKAPAGLDAAITGVNLTASLTDLEIQSARHQRHTRFPRVRARRLGIAHIARR